MRLPLLIALLGLIGIGASASTFNESNGVVWEGANSCGKTSGSASRSIAYYQSWNPSRFTCDKATPSQLDVRGFTHLIFAHLLFDANSYQVGVMQKGDEDLYREFIALPDSVSKWISVGGGQFGGGSWSKMASTNENRKVFIDSLKQFLGKWNFRGVEIDWEWPSSPDDKRNHVELLTELRQTLGKDIGLSVAIPAQEDRRQNIDAKGLEAQIDWLTIQTYNLHGPSEPSSSGLRAHTDAQEIQGLLQTFWTSNVEPRKVNLAITNFARGYTVSDKNCMYWGCPFNGPSRAGWCTAENGLLSECEIIRVVSERLSSPWQIIPGGADTNSMTWDDQWVSFDDGNSRRQKTEMANDNCMGGTALWALDFQRCDTAGSAPQPGPSNPATPSEPVSGSTSASSMASTGSPLAPSSRDPSNPSPSDPPSSSFPGAPGPSQSGPAIPSPPGAPNTSSLNAPGPSASGDPSPSSQVPSNSAPSDSPATSQPGFPTPSTPGSPGSSPLGSPGPSSTGSVALSHPGSPETSSAGVPGTSSPGIPGTSSGLLAPSESGIPGPSSTDSAATSQPGSSITSSPGSPGTSSPGIPGTSPGSLASSQSGAPQPSSPGSSAVSVSGSPAQSSPGDSATSPWGAPSSLPVTSPSSPSGTASPGVSSSNFGSPTFSPSGLPTPSPSGSSQAESSSKGTQASSGASGVWTSSEISTSASSGQTPSTTQAASSGSSPAGSSQSPSSQAGSSQAGSSAQTSWAPSSNPVTSPSGTSVALTTPSDSNAPSTTPAPVASGTSSAVVPSGSGTPFCPNECWDMPWCRPFCERGGHDLDENPPSQCWDNWWCWLWWGFPSPDPKCKLLGCGCGWMGLPWGPGGNCKTEAIKFPINLIIRIFGLFPDPCKWFGCEGSGTCGILGCDGYCFGKEGCTPCPELFCPKGGPKSGPPPPGKYPKPPTPPNAQKPAKCDPKDYKTATERMVYCGEFKYLSSTLSMTTLFSSATTVLSTATSASSTCHTAVDITISGCNVAGYESTATTSVTYSNTLSESEGPACTRAPLSLDDDEGPNDPPDWLSSVTFVSNSSTIGSPTSSKTSSSSTTPTTSTPVATSTTPASPMDKFGTWNVSCHLWMENQASKFEWVLYDPSGNQAGRADMYPRQGTDDYKLYVESQKRPLEHTMPYALDAWFVKPTDIDEARVQFKILKEMKGCPIASTGPCYPSFSTENKLETQMFEVESCYEHCRNQKDIKLNPADLNCQDMNDADWYKNGNAWERKFWCWFKGF